MALKKHIIIHIGIVEFVSKENSDYSIDEIIDKIPDLNIYEKIQLILFMNIYIENIDYIENIEDININSPKNKISSINKTNHKSLPIPKKFIK
jgi:hypothetical protein